MRGGTASAGSGVIRTFAIASVLFAAAGCRSISPLGNRIGPGTEPFLVLIGEGSDGQTDLFAASGGGGEVVRLTFTRGAERAPALHPSGTAVAFVRESPVPGRPSWLVVMNLINSAEREVALPGQLGEAERVGWSRDGSTLYVRGTGGTVLTPAPPASLALESVGTDDPLRGRADTALAILLGDPPVARVVACPPDITTSGFCAELLDGTSQPLGAAVSEPFRWGRDSLGYFDGDRLMVRPLAGGRPRPVGWTRAPANARQATYHPGPAGL